jgi:hypothetical protein
MNTDFSALPRNVVRRRGAEIVTQHFLPISHPMLEAWPLNTRAA